MLSLLKSKIFWILISYLAIFIGGYRYATYKEAAIQLKVTKQVIKKYNKQVIKDEKVVIKEAVKQETLTKAKEVIHEKLHKVKATEYPATSDRLIRLYNEAVKAANAG